MTAEDTPGEDWTDFVDVFEDRKINVSTDTADELIDFEGEVKMPDPFDDWTEGVGDALDASEAA